MTFIHRRRSRRDERCGGMKIDESPGCASSACAIALLLVITSAPRAAAAEGRPAPDALQTSERGARVPGGPTGGGGKSEPEQEKREQKKERLRPAVPAGVYGAIMSPAGEMRFIYTPTYMVMRDNYIGTSTISPTAIATTIPYYRLGPYETTTPATQRIVSNEMRIQTHTLRVRYGITDWLNLTFLTSVQDKNIDQTVFRGPRGATVLAPWTVVNTGWGDSAVQALVRLYQDDIHHLHVNLGTSIPTGNWEAISAGLAPSGVVQWKRCCYGVQIGFGTFDALFGVTYTAKMDAWTWAFAYRGRVAFGDNPAGYHRGPIHEITAWTGYEIAPRLNLTARAAATVWDRVRGRDLLIYGPLPGANPYYYGGERVRLLGGLEYIAKIPSWKPIRISVEAGAPVYQRLNGPQLGESWELNTVFAFGF